MIVRITKLLFLELHSGFELFFRANVRLMLRVRVSVMARVSVRVSVGGRFIVRKRDSIRFSV